MIASDTETVISAVPLGPESGSWISNKSFTNLLEIYPIESS